MNALQSLVSRGQILKSLLWIAAGVDPYFRWSNFTDCLANSHRHQKRRRRYYWAWIRDVDCWLALLFDRSFMYFLAFRCFLFICCLKRL